MKKIYVLFIAAIFVLNFEFAKACSCDYYRKLDFRQFNNYDVVFKGKILSIRENMEEWKKEVKVLLKKVYKGEAYKDTLTVTTGLDGASCGLNFKIGQTWMIYAYQWEGNLSTGLCTRSKLLNGNPLIIPRLQAEKRFLKRYNSYSGVIYTSSTKGELLKGKPVGKWTYYKEGRIWETNQYSKQGKLHGNSEVYYENGLIHYRTEYIEGQYIKSTYYDKEGKVERVYKKE